MSTATSSFCYKKKFLLPLFLNKFIYHFKKKKKRKRKATATTVMTTAVKTTKKDGSFFNL